MDLREERGTTIPQMMQYYISEALTKAHGIGAFPWPRPHRKARATARGIPRWMSESSHYRLFQSDLFVLCPFMIRFGSSLISVKQVGVNVRVGHL